MAKSKDFFGLRRGSTRTHTFSVLHGEQITKARVTDIANPRSVAQMAQRLTFAGAVQFYKHANHKFFKCAYEDKKRNESDYNAFMRFNTRKAVAMTKYMIESNMPAIGNYVLTSGRLGQIQPKSTTGTASGTEAMTLDIYINESARATNYTLGDFSRALIEEFPAVQNGDIITYLRISGMGIYPIPTFYTAISQQNLFRINNVSPTPRWEIIQERLDINSTEPSRIFIGMGNEVMLQAPGGVVDLDSELQRSLYGVALMISRPLADGTTLVTTSIIGTNDVTQLAIDIGMSDDWKEFCAENYKQISANSLQDVILKGSMLPPTMASAANPFIWGYHADEITLGEPDIRNTGITLKYKYYGDRFDEENIRIEVEPTLNYSIDIESSGGEGTLTIKSTEAQQTDYEFTVTAIVLGERYPTTFVVMVRGEE